MGTIADKLTYLAGTKNAIKQAIIDKGVEVADTDTFRSYATKIADIRSGTPAEWEWPADWPDITSIVESDTDNDYQHKCIWLLDGENPYFDYSFGTYVQKVLLSDGTTYTKSFTDHEWETNTDTSITDYKYIILYMSSNGSFQKDGRPISMTYNSAFLSGKTNFSSMFQSCSSLQTIPLLDTSSVTNFSYMFGNCYSLQIIPQLDTSSGTNFSNMFNGCSSLQTIPQIDTSSGTNFSSMFQSCPSLQTIPQLDTSSGTSFIYMFFSCSLLQYIDATSPTSHNYNFSVSFDGSKLLSKASIINIFNNLPTLTETEQTITITNATNAKLTTEEKEIVTDGKGWTITVSG